MRLSQLLSGLNIALRGEDREISFITDDSRKCKYPCIFVCHEKGEEYVSEAVSKGAVAIVAKRNLNDDTYETEDTRKAYNILCREFFSYPERKLKMIAVTGTNGKTSVSSMIFHMLRMNGHKTGLIGTVLNETTESTRSDMTTPDCFELYSMLSHMAENNFEYCVIEASSQGLSQKRLYGIEFETAVFTNLTEDHLDYHKTFENYKAAKLSLFENSKRAIINYDDKFKDEFLAASKGRVFTYSVCNDEADFTARAVNFRDNLTVYEFVSDSLIHRISFSARGDFWVSNSLAAVVCAFESGLSIEECAFSLRTFTGVKGRMEMLRLNCDFDVIIDYAHTPDALQSALLSLRKFCKRKLILVFGCGGNREKEKRQKMGRVAVTYADTVFVTSDNPRNENPEEIIDDILEGIKKGKTSVYIHTDRKTAIEKALKTAKKGDIVLLAGKGHEEYQIIGEEKLPFDERLIVKNLI